MTSFNDASPRDKVIRRVHALLQQAEKTTFPEEAETFSAKAMELITKHQIEAAELSERNKERATIIDEEFNIFGNYRATRVYLFAQIMKILGVDGVLLDDYRGEDTTMHMFGLEADMDFGLMLFNSITQQMDVALGIARREAAYVRSSQVFNRSFVEGYSHRIIQRLRDARKHTVEASTSDSTALVLLDKNKRSSQAMHEYYPRVTTKKTRRHTQDWFAYDSGADAANRARLFSDSASLSDERAQLEGALS